MELEEVIFYLKQLDFEDSLYKDMINDIIKKHDSGIELSEKQRRALYTQYNVIMNKDL